MKKKEGVLFWAVRRDPTGVLAAILLLCFFVMAGLGVFLTEGPEPLLDPKKVRLHEKLRPPLSKPLLETASSEELPLGVFLLGTDELGRDVFARMLQGAFVSMSVGFISVGISVFIGIILGGIAGYYGDRDIGLFTVSGILLMGVGVIWWMKEGGNLQIILFCLGAFFLLFRNRSIFKNWNRPLIDVDSFIMRIVDIMLCFPSFFLILTVVALLPPNIYNIMVVIGLTSWMGTARFVRAEFLALRELEFVKAAKLLGLSEWRIIFIHMLPNALGPVLVSATIGVASAILVEAGLSFLGLGVPPPHATWGNILSEGKNYLFDAPWLTFIPGFAIMIVVLSFNMLGETLRDVINPRLRA
ncbi:MAG: ABC transporter permease [Desulfatiglandales bacterium]